MQALHKTNMKVVWFGCFEDSSDIHNLGITQEEQADICRRLYSSEEFCMVPLFFTQDESSKWFQVYCLQIVWPVLHYVNMQLNEGLFNTLCWEAYCKCNSNFADAVKREWKSNDLIWVVDFHGALLRAPLALRRRIRDVRVGLFLDCPFPSTEIFRLIPNGSQLLEGMLGADILAFHTFSYARYFLSSCMRMLGLETTIDSLEYKRHTTSVRSIPMGTDPEFWADQIRSEPVQQRLAELKVSFKDKHVILGVDGLDYIQGIPLKLLSFEKFLELNPDMAQKVVMVQIGYPPDQRKQTTMEERPEYLALQADVNELVGKINGRFGTADSQPIFYINKFVSLDELSALYIVAEVVFISSIREGTNIICQEFVCCQNAVDSARTGDDKWVDSVVLLSEFSGGTRRLPGAMVCNPWHPDHCADQILNALSMSPQERKLRRDMLVAHIEAHTARVWGLRLCTELQQVMPASQQLTRILPSFRDQAGMVYEALNHSNSRLFVFDYDAAYSGKVARGGIKRLTRDASPSKTFLQLVHLLSSIPLNVVLIVSRRSAADLTSWFGHTNAVLAAEHGCFLRLPYEPSEANEMTAPVSQEPEQPDGDTKSTPQRVPVDKVKGAPTANTVANLASVASQPIQTSDKSNPCTSIESRAIATAAAARAKARLQLSAQARNVGDLDCIRGPTGLSQDDPSINIKEMSMAERQARLDELNKVNTVNSSPHSRTTTTNSKDVDELPFDKMWKWHPLNLELDTSFREQALQLLQHYTERTPGSYVEQRQSAVVWHFHEADSDYASWQSSELISHLRHAFAKQPIEVTKIGRSVEIRPFGITEEQLIERVLLDFGRITSSIAKLKPAADFNEGFVRRAESDVDEARLPDFVFCLGDDEAKPGVTHAEGLFKALTLRSQNSEKNSDVGHNLADITMLPSGSVIICSIGSRQRKENVSVMERIRDQTESRDKDEEIKMCASSNAMHCLACACDDLLCIAGILHLGTREQKCCCH